MRKKHRNSFRPFNRTNRPSMWWRRQICQIRQNSSFYNDQFLFTAFSIYNELKTTPSYSIHASLSKAGTPTRASVGSAGNASIKQNNDRNRNKDLVLSRTAMSLSTAFDRLTGSIDMLSAQAETYFYNSEYKKCSNLLEK